MAAYEILLLNTAIPQIQAAQSGDTYLVPRDIAFSAALTLSAGTANGVPYLNASKVLTTGSALTYNGNTLGLYSATAGLSLQTSVNTNQAIITLADADGRTAVFRSPNSGSPNLAQIGTTTNHDLAFLYGNSEQMRLTSIGLGIGTSSPAMKLDVRVSNSASLQGAFNLSNSVNSDFSIQLSSSVAQIGTGTSTPIVFATGNAEKMRLDSSGNLGLGVTPSAWISSFKGFDLSTAGAITGSGNGSILWGNAYIDAAAVEKYKTNGYAVKYVVAADIGAHIWQTAPSGTAGNAIPFTQAMTLDASGNLLVGGTSNAVGARAILENASGNQIGLRYTSVATYYNSVDSSGNLLWTKDGTERARITSGGDFQTSSGNSVMVGGTAARATTAGTNRVDIFDGTAPVGTLANGVSFYSASGEANVMDAAGNATLLSPHDAETNEWIFRSKHTPTGKVLKIDVERLLKFVNDHFGLDAVHEFIEK